MATLALFLTLAALGIIDSGYLMYNHHQKKPLICPMSHDCSKVTESKYAKLFGVRNEILGFLFYSVVFLSGILLAARVVVPYLLPFIFIATFLSLLTSASLSAIEIFKLKDYCFYCIISAVINLLLFITSIFLV